MYNLRLPIAIACLLLTLAGSRWAANVENAELKQTDFLAALEIPFNGWAELDLDLTPKETEFLQPDAVLMRRYESVDGESLELLVIAGSRKRSVHTPSYCLPGGGWEMVQQHNRTFSVGGYEVPVTQALMADKAGQAILVTYFFTDGHFSTSSIGRFQVAQLLKRFRKQVPLGALVRVVTPVTRDPIHTERLTSDFAGLAFPKVLDTLKEVGRSRP